jgi:F420-non-reducing hydrogenase small subunit
LANQFSREHILRYVFEQAPTVVNPDKVRPQAEYDDPQRHALTLPVMREGVRSLDQVVDIDYAIPGCAPPPSLLKKAVEALRAGRMPPKGAVLAPDVALCDECPRKETKPADLSFAELKRPHQVIIDQNQCILAQGVACMGPATRAGCDAACTRAPGTLPQLGQNPRSRLF